MRPEPAHGWRRPWTSYRVIRPKPAAGRWSFWLGSNGERMARSKDWAQLSERHPEVAAWAAKVATDHARMTNDLATVSAIEAERAADEAMRWEPEPVSA